MVRVVQQGRFSVYVYVETGGRHNLPHCHLRWSDGESQIALPSLRLLNGSVPPAAARDLLEAFRDELTVAWIALNPERPIK